jgi:Ser/Thr protein kinase RdoA (MazF antagonist)
MPELDAIISRLEPDLGPLDGDPQPLDGGITNRNYRVRLGGEDLVLRVCDHGAEVLGIDRTTEEIAARRAAAEGIAPAVVAFLSDVPALVTR